MKKYLAMFGIILACTGGALSLFMYTIRQKAISLDSPLESTGCGNCAPKPPAPSCSKGALYFTELHAPKVMSVSESQVLSASLYNRSEKDCKVSVSIDAPNFTTSSERKQTYNIAKSETTQFKWVLSPVKPGTYNVMALVTTGDDVAEKVESKDVGISVTNVFGLQANQASLLSVVSATFGPILTLPYWLDKWQKRKDKEKQLGT